MAFKIRRTSDIADVGVKILVYGESGAGKTCLIPTIDRPFILSSENGLSAISEVDLPYSIISSHDDVIEAYNWIVGSAEASQYSTIAIDSLTDIAEAILAPKKAKAKDPRQAYVEMADEINDLVRKFRDIPGYHVYMTAQLEKIKDEFGSIVYGPNMPGKQLGPRLPYKFDIVSAMRIVRNNGEDPYRVLQCDGDGSWLAKDRTGKLNRFEEPDLGAIITKITGVRP
jgi:phage nucleotide-binding protein